MDLIIYVSQSADWSGALRAVRRVQYLYWKPSRGNDLGYINLEHSFIYADDTTIIIIVIILFLEIKKYKLVRIPTIIKPISTIIGKYDIK